MTSIQEKMETAFASDPIFFTACGRLHAYVEALSQGWRPDWMGVRRNWLLKKAHETHWSKQHGSTG